jgi:hypothetical protein
VCFFFTVDVVILIGCSLLLFSSSLAVDLPLFDWIVTRFAFVFCVRGGGRIVWILSSQGKACKLALAERNALCLIDTPFWLTPSTLP